MMSIRKTFQSQQKAGGTSDMKFNIVTIIACHCYIKYLYVHSYIFVPYMFFVIQ